MLCDKFNIISAIVAPLCSIISIIFVSLNFFFSSSLSSSSGGFFGGGSGGLLLSSILVKADTIASRWFFNVCVACVLVGSFLLYVLCQKFLSIILNILSWFSFTLNASNVTFNGWSVSLYNFSCVSLVAVAIVSVLVAMSTNSLGMPFFISFGGCIVVGVFGFIRLCIVKLSSSYLSLNFCFFLFSIFLVNIIIKYTYIIIINFHRFLLLDLEVLPSFW